MNVTDAITPFLNYIRTERRLSDHTVKAYSTDLEEFRSFLASRQIVSLDEVSHWEVRDWEMEMIDNGQNPNSVKRRMATLRSWFKFLRRQHWVDSDIMAKVKAPKTPKHLPVFFTENETRSIYDDDRFPDSFEGRRDQLLLRLLYETGMRRAEVVGLTEDSVDFAAGNIKVLGKRDKERIIPIENELAHTIKSYFSLKRQIEGCSKAFFVRADGSPFNEYCVTKVVKQFMTPISHADRISPHIFRHSFATHLLNEGADINAIKELLGHTDLAATEVYTHVSRQHLKETYKHAHPRATKKKE